jgi:hypothetical protein
MKVMDLFTYIVSKTGGLLITCHRTFWLAFGFTLSSSWTWSLDKRLALSVFERSPVTLTFVLYTNGVFLGYFFVMVGSRYLVSDVLQETIKRRTSAGTIIFKMVDNRQGFGCNINPVNDSI